MPFMKEGRPAKIDAYVPMINEIISSLGVDPSTCYNDEKKVWSLQKDDAKVDVVMFSISQEGSGTTDYIEIASPVMKVIDVNLENFFRRLLEINNTSIGVKFALDQEWVWLLVQRELEGLDRSEILTMLDRIGNFSNDMKQQLKDEFLS